MKIVKAEGFVARLVGWLGRRSGLADEALWLVPCRGVHTLGMRFPIDLVFLDRAGRVLRIDEGVKPWRCRWHRHAHSVVELTAGVALATGVTLGTRLRLTRGVEWNALHAKLPIAVVPLALALALGCQPDPAFAGAPLLEPPSAVPVTIEFETEWPAEVEPLNHSASSGNQAGANGGTQSVGRAPNAQLATSGLADPPAFTSLRSSKHHPHESLERLLSEADSLYRGRRWQQAFDAYRVLLERDPRNRTAWLRLGNLHHRSNQLAQAASAYRKAAQGSAASHAESDETTVRGKALANLASVNLELARESLNQLQAMRLPAGSAAAGLRDRAAADWRSLDQSARALEGSGSAQPGGTPDTSAAPASRSSDPATPAGGLDLAGERGTLVLAPPRGHGPRATVEYLRDAPIGNPPTGPTSAPAPVGDRPLPRR